MKKFILFVVVVVVLFFGYRWMSSPSIQEPASLPAVIINGEDGAALKKESDTQPVQVGNAVMAEEEAGRIVATPVSNENIRLTSPAANSTVSSPLRVAGEANVFENVVSVRIQNAKGETLIEEVARAHAPDAGQFGPFEVNINYQFSNTKEGFIEVSSQSPKDGSKENVVRVPVKFE